MGRVLNRTERAGTSNPSAVLRLLQRVSKSGRGGDSGK
jgi:hypothetical protein